MRIIFHSVVRTAVFRMLWVLLWVCVLTFVKMPLRAAQHPEQQPLLPARITAELDSLRALSERYERAGDSEDAYLVERRRLQMRDSLRSIYLTHLIDQYEENFHNEDLELTRLHLLNQNAQMEIAQVENAREVLRLREEQDSILIANTHIQLDNATAKEELAEKNRQLQEAEMARKYDEQRWSTIILWSLAVLMVVVLGFSLYYLITGIRGNAALRRQRELARQDLQRAELANRAQNEFMRQFDEGIQLPAEEICAASHSLSDAAADHGAADTGVLSEQEREEKMEQIRRKTEMLLNRLAEIADHCSESPQNKTLSVLLLLVMTLTHAAAPTVQAQDNTYGIADDFYQYYKRCDRMVQDPAVMAMSDTLFAMGEKVGDKLTQCLAYDIRMGHAYFTKDIDSIRREQRRLYDFVINTPYKDYIFLGWNRIIIHYLDHNEFYEAMLEAHSYQEAALRLNNAYGIARGYYYIGEVYRMRGMRSEAVEKYKTAIENQQKYGGKSRIVAAACTRIGEIYIDEGNYREAEKYLRRALANHIYNFEAVNATIELFRMYVNMGDIARAKTEKAQVEIFAQEDLLIGSRVPKYRSGLVRYYLLEHKYDEALKCANTIADKDPETLSLAQAAVGHYNDALHSLRLAATQQEQIESSLDVSRLISFQTEYDNMLMQKQNDQLKLQQTRFRLEQLQRDKELAVEKSRRDSIAINNQRLQQQSIESAGKIREAEISYKLEALKHAEQASDFQHKILWTVTAILLVVIGFSFLALMLRRKHARQLRKELRATEVASRAAEEATWRKRRFLQQVSHEIRTPLNSIIGFNEVLSDPTLCNNLSDADRLDLRQRSLAATAAFNHLVSSAIELCRVESGTYTPKVTAVRIYEVVQRAIKLCSPRLLPAVQIQTSSNEINATFATDAEQLQLILMHLLDNACKFTKEGSITVDYRLSAERLYLIVTDTGCGVPRRKAEEIFNNFTKLNEFVPGIGLGLSLCRALTKMLHGTIELDTEYTGGCRFVVVLNAM